MQDHEAAQKLREQLWKLQDKGNPITPQSVTKIPKKQHFFAIFFPRFSEAEPPFDHPHLTVCIHMEPVYQDSTNHFYSMYSCRYRCQWQQVIH